MALPKRKFSKSRRDKKRTHKKLSLPAMATCSHCSQVKSPHRVCPHCGYYNGKKVVEIKKAS
ncbi:MAG: 50S ribosomal protein L32 [bacterium]